MERKEVIKNIESQIAHAKNRQRRAESDLQYEEIGDEIYNLNRELDRLKSLK